MFFNFKLQNFKGEKITKGLPCGSFSSMKSTAGFTLIELIVVMAIFTIITSVVVFNYGKFSSNMVVTNLAYEAALAVRQAQVYGISVKQTKASLSGTPNFNAAYGVWFSPDKQNFQLFAHKNAITDIRDPGEDEETFSMNGSNIIDHFCVFSNGISTCNNGVRGIDSISVNFKRPNTNAYIYAFSNNGIVSPTSPANGGGYDSAEIMFTSGRGDKIARMTVWSTGQISIDSCNAPGKTCP